MRAFLPIAGLTFVLLPFVACGGATQSSPDDAGGVSANNRSDASVDTSLVDAGHTDGGQSTDAAPPSKDATCSAATKEGDACSVEGAFCNPSPCTDECNFCNALHCESGTWGRMEAFPMPESYCGSVACGTLTCGKGQFCVRTTGGPAGAEPSYACAKLPSGCVDCTCASKAACPDMEKTCTADPDTQKPIVDCAAP